MMLRPGRMLSTSLGLGLALLKLAVGVAMPVMEWLSIRLLTANCTLVCLVKAEGDLMV